MAVKSRRIAILAMPGVQLLDVSGPLDVFAEANRQSGRNAYELLVVGMPGASIKSSSGVRLLPDLVIGQDDAGNLDTLLVAGCPDAGVVDANPTTVAWLKHTAPKCRRYGSVCAGAYLLAATGLIDGRRVTTHWAVAADLAQKYPAITVDEDAIHVKDGPVRTAAGVTAGLDLALALVEEDLGRDLALKVASQLVMFFKRPGGQMQFSRENETQIAGRAALQELQRWISSNPGIEHSVPSLAERVQLSPRHLSRLFRNEIGMTPAAWVEVARVNAARKMLELRGNVPKLVANQCGFADVDVMRRAFRRHVGVTPAEYRRRFGTGD